MKVNLESCMALVADLVLINYYFYKINSTNYIKFLVFKNSKL